MKSVQSQKFEIHTCTSRVAVAVVLYSMFINSINNSINLEALCS